MKAIQEAAVAHHHVGHVDQSDPIWSSLVRSGLIWSNLVSLVKSDRAWFSLVNLVQCGKIQANLVQSGAI